MAELLVKAVDHVHSDPAKDQAECYKKGDLVVAVPDGHVWGTREGPPQFVIVKCPELDLTTARQRIESWDYVYDFEVLSRSIPLDGWRFKVTNPQRRASDGAATPSPQKVQAFLEKWGATFVRVDPDGVVVDWTIEEGALSEGFHGEDPAALGFVIAESGYDEGTGVHTFTIDYSGYTGPGTNIGIRIQRRIAETGGTVEDVTPPVITYSYPRDVVRDTFHFEVRTQQERFKRTRYSFPVADVDTALGLGGVVTLTLAQLQARVIDHRTL